MKTTIALLIIACVTAALIWMFEFHPAFEKTGIDNEGRVLSIVPEQVTNLIVRKDGRLIEFAQANNEWMIVSPVLAHAKSTDINKILYAMETMSANEIITESDLENRGLTLGDYGLEKPAVELSVRCASARHTLHIGRRAPLGNTVYVMTPPDKNVILVQSGLDSLIPADHNKVRDRRLLKNQMQDVRRMEIRKTGRPTIQLAKREKQWLIESPTLLKADSDKVNKLLNRLFETGIQTFVSDSAGDSIGYGLNEEESPLQVTLWMRGSESGKKISFGKETGEDPSMIYANIGGSPSVYAVDAELASLFDTNVSELWAGTLYFMPEEKTGFVRLGCAGKTLELNRQPDGHWLITAPVRYKAETQKVRELISKLNNMPASGFHASATNLFQHELFNKPLYFAEMAEHPPAPGTEQNTIPADPSPGGSRFLSIPSPEHTGNRFTGRFAGFETIYTLKEDMLKTICFDVNYYRERIVLNLDPAGIVRITLEISGTRHVVEWHEEKKAWYLSEPAGSAINKNVITKILESANEWKAKRFLPETRDPPGSYGLEKPRAVLTLGIRGEEGISKTIMFGDISEDLGIYAMIQGQDLIFVVEKATVDAILAGLVR